MNISQVNSIPSLPSQNADPPVRSGLTETTEAEQKSQAMRNAMMQLQARYGEKPREIRPVKKTLDKDDFLKIMITEMKHQDPTKPMDADKMASQMAQLTSVEQLKNMGTAIEKLADKNQASDRMAMSGMIGKNVTVDKGRFSHQKGNLSPLNFVLPEDASKVTLKILDEQGEEIATRELEPLKAGPNNYNWDGLNSSNISVASGSYMIRVDAENEDGKKIKLNPISQEKVIGVSFEGGEANFLVGDPKSPQRVAFKNVTRIESDSSQRASAQPEAQDTHQAFEIPASVKEKFKDQTVADQRVADQEEVRSEGFPSGLGSKE